MVVKFPIDTDKSLCNYYYMVEAVPSQFEPKIIQKKDKDSVQKKDIVKSSTSAMFARWLLGIFESRESNAPRERNAPKHEVTAIQAKLPDQDLVPGAAIKPEAAKQVRDLKLQSGRH